MDKQQKNPQKKPGKKHQKEKQKQWRKKTHANEFIFFYKLKNVLI